MVELVDVLNKKKKGLRGRIVTDVAIDKKTGRSMALTFDDGSALLLVARLDRNGEVDRGRIVPVADYSELLTEEFQAPARLGLMTPEQSETLRGFAEARAKEAARLERLENDEAIRKVLLEAHGPEWMTTGVVTKKEGEGEAPPDGSS